MPRVTARTLVLAFTVALPAPLLAQVPAADVPETHTVKRGDTLWDLSHQYFGDALLWPRLYQMNTAVVEDPHWIYPGEVLHLRSDSAVASVPTTEAPATPQPVVVANPTVDTTAAPTDSARTESAQVVEAPPTNPSAPAVDDTTPIFGRQTSIVSASPMFRADFVDNYRAVTATEFHQAGFLTEGKDWSFGTVIGTIAPVQVDAHGSQAATIYATIAIRPPAQGAYQVGDTLLSLTLDRKPSGGFGQIATPNGLIRVTDVSRPEILGVIIGQYGAIDPGTYVMMAERFSIPRGVRAAPLADGLEGTLVAFRATDVLRGVGDVVFIDKGRNDGIKIGDVLEARRTLRPAEPAAVMIPEVVARFQVIHLGDRTATARVTWVAYPDIPAGTRWKLIARLPG